MADPDLVKRLIAAPATQWQAILAGSTQTGYSRSPSDTNYPLLRSALDAAAARKPFDFAVVAGDALRHEFADAFVRSGGSPDQFPAFAAKTAVFVLNAIQATLGVPVYYALGNDDSPCGDYRMAPGSPFLALLADALQVFARHPDAAAAFRVAGFYEVPHPTLPDEEMVVLNSILWSTLYADCGAAEGSDPGAAEIEWLSWKLYEARVLGHKVVLVMHIPPGVDAYRSSRDGNCASATPFWRDRYLTPFLELMQRYRDIVQIALAGHTHMDDFRVLSTGTGPAVALRITPSVSPIFGNNPAFSILQYSLETGAVSDVTTFYLDLSADKGNPQWGLEYRFSSAYGYAAFSPANLEALAARIRDDPSTRQTFTRHYAALASPSITAADWPFYSCAQVHLVPADYVDCVCALLSARSRANQR